MTKTTLGKIKDGVEFKTQNRSSAPLLKVIREDSDGSIIYTSTQSERSYKKPKSRIVYVNS